MTLSVLPVPTKSQRDLQFVRFCVSYNRNAARIDLLKGTSSIFVPQTASNRHECRSCASAPTGEVCVFFQHAAGACTNGPRRSLLAKPVDRHRLVETIVSLRREQLGMAVKARIDRRPSEFAVS